MANGYALTARLAGGGELSGGQLRQLAIGRALVTRPRLLLRDEPTEGIQPSIFTDIGRAFAWLRDEGAKAMVVVEQDFDVARDLADDFVVLDRREVVVAGDRAVMARGAAEVRQHLTV